MLASFSTSEPACTLVAVTTQFTLTQGLGTPAILKAQPAMMKVSLPRKIGAPACAFGLPGAAVTVPPCGQVIMLAVVSSGGITLPPTRRY
jgi:hypothetical protein